MFSQLQVREGGGKQKTGRQGGQREREGGGGGPHCYYEHFIFN